MKMAKYTNENARFIKGEVEIMPGRDYEVIIEDCREEELTSRDGGTTKKPVLYMRGKKKSLPLNKTNAKMITSVIGSDDTEDWRGRKIILYANYDTAFGKEGYFIRVRPKGYVPGQEPEEMIEVEGDGSDQGDDDDIPF